MRRLSTSSISSSGFSGARRTFSSFTSVRGLGHYKARDGGDKAYVVYVFEVEQLGDVRWKIYRRYSQICDLAEAILVRSETPFPSRHLFQPYALTHDQVDQRFFKLKSWVESIFSLLVAYHNKGAHIGSKQISMSIQMFTNFLRISPDQPPLPYDSMPSFALPVNVSMTPKRYLKALEPMSLASSFYHPRIQTPRSDDVHTFDESKSFGSVSPGGPHSPTAQNTFVDPKLQAIEQRFLGLEVRTLSLQSCLEEYLRTTKTWLLAGLYVAEEFEKLDNMLKADSKTPEGRKRTQENDRLQQYVQACRDLSTGPYASLAHDIQRKALSLVQGVCNRELSKAREYIRHLAPHNGSSNNDINGDSASGSTDDPVFALERKLQECASSWNLTAQSQLTLSEQNAQALTRVVGQQRLTKTSNVGLTESSQERNVSGDWRETASRASHGKKALKTLSSAVVDEASKPIHSKVWVWGTIPGGDSVVPILRPQRLQDLNLKNISQVACGAEQVLYLTPTGDVFQYISERNNPERQTGSLSAPTFVQCFALDKALHGQTIAFISCGAQHSAALTDGGELYTWGKGTDGRLGHGDSRDRSVPRKVMGLLGMHIAKAYCGGSHTVAANDNGEVFTWGRGRNGRLGHGDDSWRDYPKQIQGLKGHRIKAVSCGWNFNVAVSEGGSVFAWGKQAEGQCGVGFIEEDQLTPARLPAFGPHNPQVVQVSCGSTHTLALTDNGELFSWGLGEHGQLGLGVIYQPQPQRINLFGIITRSENVQSVNCGAFHSTALTSQGSLLVWGLNTHGALGLGHTNNKDLPQRVDCFDPGSTWKICCGENCTLLLENPKDEDEGESSDGSPRLSGKRRPLIPESGGLSAAERTKEREKWTQKALKIWQTRILSEWERGIDSKAAHTMWRQGLPPAMRAHLWPLAIGNELKITPEMYEMCRDRAQKQQQFLLLAESESEEWGTETTNPNVIGRELSMKLIHTDLSRTFAPLRLFDHTGPFYNQLLELLQTYACYRPDLGYIQGMSYLAAMLCLYLGDKPLANLMVREHLFAFYLMDLNLAESYYNIYDQLLASHSPKLHWHLKELGIAPSMYIMSWLQTLFLQVLPMEIASRVWDCFLLDGTIFLFRTCLAIQDILSPILLKSDLEDCLMLLQKSYSSQSLWDENIKEEELFQAIAAIHVPSHIYDSLDSLIHEVYFYSKDMLGIGHSARVRRIKEERRSMYSAGDALNGILGSF